MTASTFCFFFLVIAGVMAYAASTAPNWITCIMAAVGSLYMLMWAADAGYRAFTGKFF